MNTIISANWQEANYCYLLAAVRHICQLLMLHTEKNQNEFTVNVPEATTVPLSVDTTLSPPPALEQLCNIFELSSIEHDILLLCAARELVPNFSELCSQAQANQQLPYPTFALASAVFPSFTWTAINPQSPLHYWQLIEIVDGETLMESCLKIDRRIFYYLLGESCLDPQLTGIMQPIQLGGTVNSVLPPSHQKLAEQLAAIWIQPTDTIALPVTQLSGADLSALHKIAATASQLVECNLSVISAFHLPPEPNRLSSLIQRIQREAILNRSILLLDCFEVNLTDTGLLSVISQFIQGINVALIVTSRDRLFLSQRPCITFDVPKLEYSEQLFIWQEALGAKASQLNGHLEGLVSQFNLSQPAIQAAISGALGTVYNHQTPEDIDADNLAVALWDSCRLKARPKLDDLAQHIPCSATWDDLVLGQQQKKILHEIVTHVRQRFKVYEQWGFARKGNRGLGIVALFAGDSGTGKTMSAEVIANELRLDLYRIDLSAVVSKYIGETQKNLRRIFDAAEAGGAVLLFDEADAMFSKRTQVKDSHDRNANMEVNYLLQRLEAYQGLAILTTNLKDSIDTAFLRRIRFIVKFGFPDIKEREAIWRRIFPENVPTKELNYTKLAQLSVAGGNIRNIALNAAFLAAEAREAVMPKHIKLAAQGEFQKIGKVLTESDFKEWG